MTLEKQQLTQKIEALQVEHNKRVYAFNQRLNAYNDKKNSLEAARNDIDIARQNIAKCMEKSQAVVSDIGALHSKLDEET